MPEQIKKSSTTKQSATKQSAASDTQAPLAARSNSKNLTADLDSLLDEIDEVLETNAEEFVKSYVQKGGQ